MNSLFEEDDREEPKSDADLTLGIGSLLSIFFGIVLICGIFFGFGYSMGRRNARTTVVPAPATTAPVETAGSSPLPPNELSGAPLKPEQPDKSPVVNPAPDETAPPPVDSHPAQSETAPANPAKTQASAKPAHVTETSTNSPSLSAVPFTHRPPLPAKPHAGISAPLEQAPGDSPIVPGHPIMVQIAAISRQEDAEVLAGALRKRGFNPSVRPGTGDKLFHVQVGPFTDKGQAESMKQHLLADGYNAIMK
jgi:DedD protein